MASILPVQYSASCGRHWAPYWIGKNERRGYM